MGGPGGLSYLWMFIVPLVAVMVVGFVDSIIYNTLFILLIVALLNTPLRDLLEHSHPEELRVLLPVSLAFVAGSMYVAEMVRIRTQNRLRVTADKLESFAFTDPLTGAFNRHALTSHFENVMEGNSEGLSFAVMDLDHFKKVNDTYGHFVGDEVLKHVVQSIRAVIPPNAHLYRWGGEEFLLILKGGDAARDCVMWETVRRTAEENGLQMKNQTLHITLSVGGYSGSAGKSIDQCIRQADKMLYQAKNSGRNRVVYTAE